MALPAAIALPVATIYTLVSDAINFGLVTYMCIVGELSFGCHSDEIDCIGGGKTVELGNLYIMVVGVASAISICSSAHTSPHNQDYERIDVIALIWRRLRRGNEEYEPRDSKLSCRTWCTSSRSFGLP